MSDTNSSNRGIGFIGALALLFIGLKLGHVIEWAWWLVLAPLWAPPAMALAVGLVIGFGLAVAALFEAILKPKPSEKTGWR